MGSEKKIDAETAQAVAPCSGLMQLKRFEEQIFFATVRIASVGSDGSASIGTGFLVRKDITRSKHVILAVSNKHVLIERTRQMILEFCQADPMQTSRYPLLGQTTRLDGNAAGELSYFEHPDPRVDLACLNVSGIGHATPPVYYRTIDLAMSATFEEEWLAPNGEVCFVGYPDGRYDKKHNLPILRRGVIASLPKIDFDGDKQFLIDAQVYQGSSGSPVFYAGMFTGQTKLLGVLNAGMIKHEKLMRMPVNVDRFGIRHTIGLGFVLKPVLIAEMVDAAVKQIRERLGETIDEPLADATAA